MKICRKCDKKITYEDYCLEGDGIVSTLSCRKCNAHVEVYLLNET